MYRTQIMLKYINFLKYLRWNLSFGYDHRLFIVKFNSFLNNCVLNLMMQLFSRNYVFLRQLKTKVFVFDAWYGCIWYKLFKILLKSRFHDLYYNPKFLPIKFKGFYPKDSSFHQILTWRFMKIQNFSAMKFQLKLFYDSSYFSTLHNII